MEREQIIKALECLNDKHDRICDECPVYKLTDRGYRSCRHVILEEAVALIKELTEENERLRGFNSAKCEDCAGCTSWKCDCANIEADTVRKMHSEIKERCIKGGIYPAFVASTIDQIAKEMLEGTK